MNEHDPKTYYTYIPSVAVPPGETLKEVLAGREMSQVHLAKKMGRPIQRINGIIKGKISITPETAIQLERVLGIPSGFWNQLELNFKSIKAREIAEKAIEKEIEYQKEFPYSEMVKLEWILGAENVFEKTKNLLNFFGAISFQNIKKTEPILYRIADKPKRSWPAVAVWLRKGVIDLKFNSS